MENYQFLNNQNNSTEVEKNRSFHWKRTSTSRKRKFKSKISVKFIIDVNRFHRSKSFSTRKKFKQSTRSNCSNETTSNVVIKFIFEFDFFFFCFKFNIKQQQQQFSVGIFCQHRVFLIGRLVSNRFIKLQIVPFA